MRRIDYYISFNLIINLLLILFLCFVSSWFVLGRNFTFLAKSQADINNDIVKAVEKNWAGTQSNKGISAIKRDTQAYNVGIILTTGSNQQFSVQDLDWKKSVLNLEVGGDLVNKQSTANGVKINLIYFRPYFTSEETIKLIPVALRLALIMSTLAIAITFLLSRVMSRFITKDLKCVSENISDLTIGTFDKEPISGAFSDINNLNLQVDELRKKLISSETLKKRMTADFAHELRTPLTTLQSHLEALIDGVWTPTRERFVSCHEEILRLIRLVGDLEKLNKLESESNSVERTEFDFTDLTKRICDNFEGKLASKNISMIFSGQPEVISADRDKISQVIVNLLSNSIKYTPINGKVLMDISGSRAFVTLTINDNGMGIPGNDIPHVFDRLYRTDASRARGTGGAGIGLTIAKSIVEAHMGAIEVISQEGIGTEITMTLPR